MSILHLNRYKDLLFDSLLSTNTYNILPKIRRFSFLQVSAFFQKVFYRKNSFHKLPCQCRKFPENKLLAQKISKQARFGSFLETVKLSSARWVKNSARLGSPKSRLGYNSTNHPPTPSCLCSCCMPPWAKFDKKPSGIAWTFQKFNIFFQRSVISKTYFKSFVDHFDISCN